MNKLKPLLLSLSASIVMSGCATGDTFDKRSAISLGTGAASAVACNQLFKNRGSRETLTALCGVGGFFLGRAFTQQSNNILETNRIGEQSTWNDPDAGQVTMTPTRTFYNQNQAPCREYTTSVEMNGKVESMKGMACRNANGTWTHSEM